MLIGLAPLSMLMGGKRPKLFTFLDSFPSGSDLTTYPFSVDIGAGHPDLRILVAITGNNNGRTFSSGLADGVALGLVSDGVTSAQNVTGGNITTALLIAHLPSSSGVINGSVTWSGGQARSGIGVWRADGLDSNLAHHVLNATGDPSGGSLNTLAGGVAVGAGMYNGGTSGVAWTGLTQDYEEAMELGIPTTGAHLNDTDGDPLSVEIDWPPAGNTYAATFASF